MQKKTVIPVICLGVVAVLCTAFAIFMLIRPVPAAAHDPDLPTLILYEGPQTMDTSQSARIWVEGHELFVYDVMVNHEHIWNSNTIPSRTPMAYFDFEGELLIEIEVPGLAQGINEAKILPSAHGIVPRVENNRVSFTVSEPGFYTVVYNDHVHLATHIFANPLETDVPDRDDPDVIFIDPGHWTLDAIVLNSGQTLYISGGAVVNSIVVVDGAQDVTIRGRGIICGADRPAWNQPGSYARVPIDIRSSRNITAEGIILINGNAWKFNSFNSDGLFASNIKIISGRQNGDGFTFQSCRNHHVADSFVRTWDDSLVIKNYAGSSRDITFERVQIWTDLAQSMEIGYETNRGLTINPTISNITFRDIHVLYANHKPIISIHNSDDAEIFNILWENITVDNAFMRGDHGVNNELIEFNMIKTHWSTVRDEWGSIRDITIDGLTVHRTLDGSVPMSNFWGANENHTLENVTLRNIYINGNRVTTLRELRAHVNDYAFNITIE
ncbi:MAG: glycosyl hydrolase family 28 protein [Defluviitaleaceae bacterium]|nr:glycosyl hydrolase family 28 protein [Defluviitaleaceae bacterium]